MGDPSQILALSKLFHERVRLGIMTVLVTEKNGVEFREMLTLLKLTKGNLSVHISKLEEAGFVKVKKEFIGKTPRTTYLATKEGRKNFSEYIKILEGIIAQAKR